MRKEKRRKRRKKRKEKLSTKHPEYFIRNFTTKPKPNIKTREITKERKSARGGNVNTDNQAELRKRGI